LYIWLIAGTEFAVGHYDPENEKEDMEKHVEKYVSAEHRAIGMGVSLST